MLEINLTGHQLTFSGELDCDTVVAHWPFKLLEKLPAVAEFDLAGLQHVDTAGLAWLLQQLAQAKQRGIEVSLSEYAATITIAGCRQRCITTFTRSLAEIRCNSGYNPRPGIAAVAAVVC